MVVRYLLRSMMESLTSATKDIMCVQIVTSRGTVQRLADQQTIDILVQAASGNTATEAAEANIFAVQAAQLVTQHRGVNMKSLPSLVLLRRGRSWKTILLSQQAHRRSFTTSVSRTSLSLRYALGQLD